MASKKRISKRMTITVSPESHKILCDFKEQTGQSASSLINEIIMESAPMLRGLIETHKKLSQGKREGIEDFKQTVYKATEELQQVSLNLNKIGSNRTRSPE